MSGLSLLEIMLLSWNIRPLMGWEKMRWIEITYLTVKLLFENLIY